MKIKANCNIKTYYSFNNDDMYIKTEVIFLTKIPKKMKKTEENLNKLQDKYHTKIENPLLTMLYNEGYLEK